MTEMPIGVRQKGATELGLVDVLTALILLAFLVWVAWMQFPVYHSNPPDRPVAKAKPAPP